MNIALIGTGRMGSAVAEYLRHHTDHRVTVEFNRRRRLETALLKDVDVIIDFSHAVGICNNLEIALAAACPFVTGTTNWEAQAPEVRELVRANRGSLFYAPNFSIGVSLFQRICALAAGLASPFDEYDISISEVHHRRKVDRPSGTAKMLAANIIEHHPRKQDIYSGSHEGPVPDNLLCISSQRVGSVPGTHQVLIDSPVDSIELIHTARGRTGFAAGAVRAAEWIVGKSGFFTIDDMMDDMFAQLARNLNPQRED